MNNTIIGTIDTATQLVGEIHQAEHLDGTFSNAEYLDGTFSNHEIPLTDYTGQYNYTPTESVQTVLTQYKSLGNNITIQAIPSDYIIPSGSLSITANGDYDVASYASASVDVQPPLQSKSATASSSGDVVIGPDEDYYGLSEATVAVPSGSATQGTLFGYTSSGTRWRVKGYNNVTQSGWFDAGQYQGNYASFYAIPAGTTVTPSTSSQTIGGNDYMMQGAVTVAPIPSDYIGSDVPRKSAADLTASGATVSVPSGYYEESTSKSVQSGAEGTPVATKGEVADHSVIVTPTVTNTEGYISGSTKTGTPVTVSASELVGGTKSITANGTGIDVINYQKVDVAVPSGQPNLQTKTKSYTPSETAQSENVTADSGYDGLEKVSVSVGAIPSNYVGSSIPRRDDDDISIVEETDDAVAVAPSGYYPGQAEKIIPYVTGQQSVSYNSTTGVITATNTFPSSGYVPSGTAVTATGQVRIAHASISANGTYYAVDDDNDAWTGVTVNVPAPSPTLQTKSKSYTPTESAQTETVTADNGYDGLSSVGVSVAAIPSNYVGTGISRRDEDDIIFNDGMVGVTNGYYPSNTVKQIPSASIYGGYDAVVTPSITVNASGLITVGILEEQNFAFCFGSGWVNASASTAIRVQGYNTLQLTNGNNLEYGLIDSTSSMVGVGKVGSMIIE